MEWANLGSLQSVEFTCGHCGNRVATRAGFYAIDAAHCSIRICPHCTKPTYFDVTADQQIPGVAPGSEVASLPPDVDSLYREARNCIAVGSHTASVLASRKLLMHIAVAQGAPEGGSFISYVNYLAEQGYVPPNGRTWVDHIRTRGNEANHEIKLMSKDDAQELIIFSEMLLKFMFEFPSRVSKPSP